MKKNIFAACVLSVAFAAASFAQQITKFAVVDTNKVYQAYFRNSAPVRNYETKKEDFQKELDKHVAELQRLNDQKVEYQRKGNDSEAMKIEAQITKKTDFINEYTSAKNTELESLKKSLENADVESTMDGIVKSINNSDEYSESESAFITILQAGDYRVKGKVDEQSYFSGEISEGQAVVVRSRVNEDTVWYGTIASVVTEEVDNSDSENNYYYDSGSTEQATKYPFYVELNSSEGLLLGQHVFIEPDYGQIQTHEGIWLSEGYFEFADDNNVYVWVADKNNKLTRRQVELGERDENTWEYQVLSGLSEDDYICFYMSGLYEGITCVTNTEEIDYSSELYSGKTDGEGEYTGENDELSGMDNLGGFEDTATGQIDSPFVLSGNPEDYGSLEDMGLTLDEESGLYKDADGYYYKFDGQSTEEPVEGESSTEDEPTTMEEQEAR